MLFRSGKSKISAADIRVLLHEKYSDHRQYAYAEEVGNATGLEQSRRLDAVVVNVYRSQGYTIEGIEIKVSRADLRRELMDSSKHNIFFDSIDYFSLATTADVLKATPKDEIPSKWGIYEVMESNGKLFMRTVRKPLSLHDEKAPAIDRPFFASLMRALCNQTPTATAIEAAFKEGEAAATKKYELQLSYSDQARIDALREELKAFQDLREQLKIWGGARGIQDAIEKFKALNAIDLRWLDRQLDLTQDKIKEVRKSIPEELRFKH